MLLMMMNIEKFPLSFLEAEGSRLQKLTVEMNHSRYWLVYEKMVKAGHQKWPLYMPDGSLASCRGKGKGY